MQRQFNISELCEEFDVSRPCLYDNLINTNKLRTFKIGRKRFATEQAVTDCRTLLEKDARVVG